MKTMLLRATFKLDYEKIVAWQMCEWGVSRRTAREYIDTLKNGGFCEEEGIEFE